MRTFLAVNNRSQTFYLILDKIFENFRVKLTISDRGKINLTRVPPIFSPIFKLKKLFFPYLIILLK